MESLAGESPGQVPAGAMSSDIGGWCRGGDVPSDMPAACCMCPSTCMLGGASNRPITLGGAGSPVQATSGTSGKREEPETKTPPPRCCIGCCCCCCCLVVPAWASSLSPSLAIDRLALPPALDPVAGPAPPAGASRAWCQWWFGAWWRCWFCAAACRSSKSSRAWVKSSRAWVRHAADRGALHSLKSLSLTWEASLGDDRGAPHDGNAARASF